MCLEASVVRKRRGTKARDQASLPQRPRCLADGDQGAPNACEKQL